jgi:serine/threonine-protein kinase
MDPSSPQCDPDALRRLLDGKLSGSEHAGRIAHLDACAACRQVLEALAAEERWWDEARHFAATETVGPQKEPEPSQVTNDLAFLTPSDAPGTLGRLGAYTISRVLGRGGMGIVLLGHDPALDRPVAIKVLAPALAADASARRRFAREARAAAAVVHEHVVAIHAVDEFAGLPYLVMQYVAGKSLQERIDCDGPLEVAEILRIGLQAATGLAAAHAQGLVHRDIKPSNILLENGVERVKLTDFGLARAVDDAGMTQSGLVPGTPQYMAPEQARGEAIDHRADLFSLGSVLYAMACGHPPFRGKSSLAVIRRVSDERPRPIRELNPELPEWLAAIIARLHAREPAQRYESASEVAEVLGQRLASLQGPNALPPPPRRTRSADWPKVAETALVVGVLALAAVVVLVARGTRKPEHPTLPPAPNAPTLSPVQDTVLGPARDIEGVVRDLDTSVPLDDCRVTLIGTSASATSGPEGRFVLSGPANGASFAREAGTFLVTVDPNSARHLCVTAIAGGPGAEDPVRFTVHLPRGMPVRVRVVDEASMGPVRGAKVVYRPLHPNPHVDFALGTMGESLAGRAVERGAGLYEVAVLPGPGVIGVENYVDHYGPVSVDPVAQFVPGRHAGSAVDGNTRYGTTQLLAIEQKGRRGIHLQPQDAYSGLVFIRPEPGSELIERRIVLKQNR